MIEKRLHTPKGDVILARDFSEDYIRNLGMGEGIGVFFHFRYQDAHKTRRILSSVCESGDNRLACAIAANCIVGYVTIVHPEPGTRWKEINDMLIRTTPSLADPVLLELGTIEVSTQWRSVNLGHELMRFMFEDPIFGEKIVFSRELSWTWDLKSTGLTPLEYRSKLLRLFESVGFRYAKTDDGEINYSGESMFTARMGERVPPEAALRFYQSLVREEPRGWGWG